MSKRKHVNKRRILRVAHVEKVDGNFYTVCPHCKNRDRMGLWAVAHQGECKMKFTCPECKKQSLLRRRCCELAEEVDT